MTAIINGEVLASNIAPIERFFQWALLGLVASGYLAIAGSGSVDAPTVVLAGIGLIWRALIISGARRIEVPDVVVTIATIGYMAFAPIDYFLLSRTWITATVHVVFFVASVKTLTARTARDYLFVAAVAFMELLAAAIFSSSGTFFFCLAAYLLCAVAALSASEIRRLPPGKAIVARVRGTAASYRLAVISLAMTLSILVLTAGLFFLLPRTANAALHFLGNSRYHLTGFSNVVSLGEVGELKNDSRPVMHVMPYSPELPLGLKWRGLALERFDGHRWSTDPLSFRMMRPDQGNWVKVAGDEQRRRPGKRIVYRVDIQNVDADALFTAGIPEVVNIGHALISLAPSGAMRVGFVPAETLRYEVSSYLDRALPPGPRGLPLAERERNLALPAIDGRIPKLAREWANAAQNDRERARSIERHLQQDFGYSLVSPVIDERRDPIASFLFERRTGYCEYFASAMTIMLRTLSIPARLVNGFQSGVVNPYSRNVLIRASDAHTWVEAYLPGEGWTVFDPTPITGRIPQQTMWTKLSLYLDAADTFWREWVLSYDLGQQLTLASRVERQARHIRREGLWSAFARVQTEAVAWGRAALRLLPFAVAAVLLIVAAVMLRRMIRHRAAGQTARRGSSVPQDATLFYDRMLRVMKKRGYQKPAWFTPQEFASSVPPSAAEDMDRFTAAYYAVRFGADSSAAREMAASFERLSR